MISQIISNRYEVIEKIGEGGTSIVYRARNIESDENRAVKILKTSGISNRIEDIIRFQSEARTITQFHHPNIIKVYDVGEYNEIQYIAMEYIDGLSLKEILKQGISLSIEQTITIAGKIAAALDYAHKRDIIHRDIAPGNILILKNNSFDFDRLKLIDFGLAQVWELNEKKSNIEKAGALAYMAPEVAGALKRTVDERSDLYSLGVVFYQLLTGGPPFKSDTVGSIIHQQNAKAPLPPRRHNEAIPSIIEKIVLKLLEKEPENRYQSADGLLNDLKKIEKGKTNFIPGLNDSFAKITYKTHMVGRDKELELLTKMFRRMKNEHGGVCFISGESGIGKTRLVEEFRERMYANEETLVEAKSFHGAKKEPYGLFKDILTVYIRRFNKYTEDKKEVIKNEIAKSIGELGEIILALNPQMKQIIGHCPSLIALDPEIENQRFQMVMSRFFRDLARLENGLVITLDDLQWSDQSALELLNEIINDLTTEPLLIIGIYRDTEAGLEHYLRRLGEKSANKPFMIKNIHLASFDINSFERLIFIFERRI